MSYQPESNARIGGRGQDHVCCGCHDSGLETELASVIDLVNDWARECGLTEANDTAELKVVIDQLRTYTSLKLITAQTSREVEIVTVTNFPESCPTCGKRL